MAPEANAPAPDRREHYRIVYPTGDRPHIRIADVRYRVNNLSESGAGFELYPGARLALATDVRASLQSPGRAEILVSGGLVVVAPLRLLFLPQRPWHGNLGTERRVVPRGAQVRLRVCTQEHEVIALSTECIELRHPDPLVLEPFPEFPVSLEFNDGDVHSVTAIWVRVEAGCCALRFAELVSYARILKEQTHLFRGCGQVTRFHQRMPDPAGTASAHPASARQARR